MARGTLATFTAVLLPAALWLAEHLYRLRGGVYYRYQEDHQPYPWQQRSPYPCRHPDGPAIPGFAQTPLARLPERALPSR